MITEVEKNARKIVVAQTTAQKKLISAQQEAHKELISAQQEAHKELISAQQEALDAISNAAQKAVQVVISNAADMAKASIVKKSEDHDLLIKIDTKVERLGLDIRDLKDGTEKRIADLENVKAEQVDFDALKKDVYGPIEARMRVLEAKTANYFITLSIFTAAVIGLISLVIYHIAQ